MTRALNEELLAITKSLGAIKREIREKDAEIFKLKKAGETLVSYLSLLSGGERVNAQRLAKVKEALAIFIEDRP